MGQPCNSSSSSVCVCVCGCMVQWFVQSISSRIIADSIPAEYGFTRLSSPSLSLGGYQQPKCVCLSMHGGQKKKKKRNCRWPKTATGSCVVQDQAPQQWWSIRSALQPDRWCNSGTSTMLAHSRAIIAYGDGRPRCGSVCMCVCRFKSHLHPYQISLQWCSVLPRGPAQGAYFPCRPDPLALRAGQCFVMVDLQ